MLVTQVIVECICMREHITELSTPTISMLVNSTLTLLLSNRQAAKSVVSELLLLQIATAVS